MTEQLSLALADRHAGQAANLAAGQKPHRDDRERVEQAVAALAQSRRPFNADLVHERIRKASSDPYDANLVSSVLGVWAQSGRIVEDRSEPPVASCRRSRRASRNRWWRGTGASQ